jgi:hypothetical protein
MSLIVTSHARHGESAPAVPGLSLSWGAILREALGAAAFCGALLGGAGLLHGATILE